MFAQIESGWSGPKLSYKVPQFTKHSAIQITFCSDAMFTSSVIADSAVLAAQLKLVGSCRGPEDKARLEQLQAYCRELGLMDCVQFCTSVPFEELSSLLAGAVGGLHTMLDEHFGISIVEYMAAGKTSD